MLPCMVTYYNDFDVFPYGNATIYGYVTLPYMETVSIYGNTTVDVFPYGNSSHIWICFHVRSSVPNCNKRLQIPALAVLLWKIQETTYLVYQDYSDSTMIICTPALIPFYVYYYEPIPILAVAVLFWNLQKNTYLAYIPYFYQFLLFHRNGNLTNPYRLWP